MLKLNKMSNHRCALMMFHLIHSSYALVGAKTEQELQ